MEKSFFIGLDIGTESIGWAVTDENYNLMRKKGRDLWGAYLFDEAETAAKTRGYRTSRRRLARTKHRLKLLQELFAEEIAKNDMSFYARLENSKYFIEDKDNIKTASVLFDDADYKDKDFYKEYPTIFHLRKALLTDEIKDVRKLYLAIHHIIKNRGHFLYEDREFNLSNTSTIISDFAQVSNYFSENELDTILRENYNTIFEIMCDKTRSNSDKQKAILDLTQSPKSAHLIAIAKALVGNTFALNDMFDTDEFEKDAKLKFTENTFDQKLQEYSQSLGEERLNIIYCLKRIYDFSYLRYILKDCQYISQAKVKSYEDHKNDLLLLKKYIKEHCSDKYALVFRQQEKKICNYARYIGMDKKKGFSKCKKEEFYDFLKKSIKIDDPYILSKILDGTFLQKQITGENCVIPYQVHLNELRAILANAEKHFPFLSQKEGGLSVSEKIISLMTFRVPYYVGPLNTQGKFSWMEKNKGISSTEKITPWNFDQVVDKDTCEEKFIRRMTNKCTYLVGEGVLPKSSLLWSEFVLLNELNNLKIFGEKNLQAKQILFDLAHKEKKMSLKKCCAELKRQGLIPKDSVCEDVFSGTDGDLKSSLSSYIDFKRILGDIVDTNPEICEQIIKWITIINDKKRLERIITKKYGNILTSAQIKDIKGLNYTKWGRFSQTLLCEIFEVDREGEYGNLSIIQALRNGTENFMELLSEKYGYSRAISLFNQEMTGAEPISYKTVDNLYCSPAVKRGIWNTIKLVKEIIKIENATPKKVFIEMTRENDTKTPKANRRTKSRKQQLQELYKSLSNDDWTELCGEISAKKQWNDLLDSFDERKLNSAKDKLYLWFTQLGRDLYTGKTIELRDVLNPDLYDIDHIYPQSKIKDDSLNNRVLVSKNFNQYIKRDVYPLPAETRNSMLSFWKALKRKGFISEEKLHRLTRSTALTLDECADFINRQIVFTNQTTKAVAEILKRLIGDDCEIVYSKAGNVSEFRRKYEITKFRELNDLHHAKDAYLNVVVGNVYNTKFNHNAKAYFNKNGYESYNLNKLYTEDIPNAWKVGDEKRIIEIVEKNTCKVVRRTSDGKGKLFDATIETAKEGLIPLKVNDPIANTAKYGGYNSETSAYFMLVKCDDKNGNPMLSIECVTVLASLNFKCENDKLRYCVDRLGLTNPKIIVKNVKINTLMELNGSYVWLKGRFGNQILLCNAKQFTLEKKFTRYLKQISNYLKDVKKMRNPLLAVPEIITTRNNIEVYDVLTARFHGNEYRGLPNIYNQSSNLTQVKENFEKLSLSEQCSVLMEILKFFRCNRALSDLKLVGLKSTMGNLAISKNITKNELKIITQSMTGFYKEVTDVQKLFKELS